MLVVAATNSSWRPCRASLSVGRSKCSSVIDDKDRLLLAGGSSSKSGEIIRWTNVGPCSIKTSVPGVKGYSNTATGGSMVFMRGSKKLYQIFRNDCNGHDDLYVASIDHNGLLSNKPNLWSNLIQCFFQNFWTHQVPLEVRDAALTSDGERYIYAVGGFIPRNSSGYKESWLKSTINNMLHINQEQVSGAVRMLDTQESARPFWREVPNLPLGRRDVASVVCGTYLYVIGGRGRDGKAMSSVVRFNVSSFSSPVQPTSLCSSNNLTWEEMAPLEAGPRYGMAAVALYGQYIVVAGGHGLSKRLKTVECYNCATNQWFKLPNMRNARMNCSLSFRKKSNQLIVAGGTSGWGIVPLETLETLEVRVQEVEHTSNRNNCSDSSMLQERMPHATTTQATSAPMMLMPPPTVPVAHATENARSTEMNPPILPSAPKEDEVYDGVSALSALTPPPAATPSALDRSCPVCLDRPKAIAFLCGHQACLECSPLLNECHSCRRLIEGRIRLFD